MSWSVKSVNKLFFFLSNWTSLLLSSLSAINAAFSLAIVANNACKAATFCSCNSTREVVPSSAFLIVKYLAFT